MHYLARFKVDKPANWDNAYLAPEGDRGWTILEAENEETLRSALEDREVEEIQPLLPAREFVAIDEARNDFENSKRRFVDDPSGALQEARQAVGRAMEARGYPSSENADQASKSRREVLEEYEHTDVGETGNLEDQRGAFDRLSELLGRLPHT